MKNICFYFKFVILFTSLSLMFKFYFQFRDTLLNKPSKFWKKIAEKQIEVFTNVEEFDLRQVAKESVLIFINIFIF